MTITEDDVNYIEDFVRNRLHLILESKSKESGLENNTKHNSTFYGNYSSLKNEFEFTRGDRRNVTMLADHIKGIVCAKEKPDYSYFTASNRSLKKNHFKLGELSLRYSSWIILS